MSLASWKREFYKTPANKVSKRFALKHSLRKWTGLLPKNRKNHGSRLMYGYLRDKNGYILDIDGSSCALCSHHHSFSNSCPDCPLSHTDCNIAFNEMLNRKVVPMINLLRREIK